MAKAREPHALDAGYHLFTNHSVVLAGVKSSCIGECLRSQFKSVVSNKTSRIAVFRPVGAEAADDKVAPENQNLAHESVTLILILYDDRIDAHEITDHREPEIWCQSESLVPVFPYLALTDDNTAGEGREMPDNRRCERSIIVEMSEDGVNVMGIPSRFPRSHDLVGECIFHDVGPLLETSALRTRKTDRSIPLSQRMRDRLHSAATFLSTVGGPVLESIPISIKRSPETANSNPRAHYL